MITASLYYYRTETYLNLSVEEAQLMQAGDIVKVAYMLPEGRALAEQLERLADGEVITLYRNTVWIQFRVIRREFFMLNHSEKGVKTLTVHAEPITWKAHEAVKLIQSHGRPEE